MPESYDYPAAEHIDQVDQERLREVWAHLTLLATGQNPAQTTGEAACMLADAFRNIFGQQVDDQTS